MATFEYISCPKSVEENMCKRRFSRRVQFWHFWDVFLTLSKVIWRKGFSKSELQTLMNIFSTIEVRIRLDVGHGLRTPSEKPKSVFCFDYFHRRKSYDRKYVFFKGSECPAFGPVIFGQFFRNRRRAAVVLRDHSHIWNSTRRIQIWSQILLFTIFLRGATCPLLGAVLKFRHAWHGG